VNRSFARRYFSTMPPLGHHLVFGANTPFSVTGEIRGIVADAREQGLSAEPMPTAYWCVSAPMPDPHYLVRTRGEPMMMADTLRRAILQVEPSRSVFDLMPLQAHLSDAFAEGRLRTILLPSLRSHWPASVSTERSATSLPSEGEKSHCAWLWERCGGKSRAGMWGKVCVWPSSAAVAD